uniref:low affinity immunoglobulin gamma Fc region receptor III-like isoform X2 n=1 Tax=Monopterus albus TaxID=43700 RepID=UPI0009B41CE4|nr:low affinity immunoglobulin gamma Fc region receptor III-like isoform X2 [Monopterus albus]
MSAFILLLAQEDHSYSAQTPDAAFPHIAPDRLQFFEYESISIRCEDTDGFTDWTVMRKLRKIIQTNSSEWNMSAPAHTIYPAFERDSGEYWCESEEGGRSNAINITVTGGSVILETPAHPVMEGVPVTLRCKKRTSSGHISEFFKDGLHFEMGYKGEVTILNVSTSHEGLYKCIMPGAGESPESRLAVTDFSAPHEEARPPPSRSRHLSLLWPLLGVLLLVLLLLMGLLHYQKAKGTENNLSETLQYMTSRFGADSIKTQRTLFGFGTSLSRSSYRCAGSLRTSTRTFSLPLIPPLSQFMSVLLCCSVDLLFIRRIHSRTTSMRGSCR